MNPRIFNTMTCDDRLWQQMMPEIFEATWKISQSEPIPTIESDQATVASDAESQDLNRRTGNTSIAGNRIRSV
jgi:hypothetical protein